MPCVLRISFFALFFFALSSPLSAQRRNAPTRIAVVADGPSDLFRDATALLATEIRSLAGEAVVIGDGPTHEGDFSAAGAQAALQRALEDDEVDMVVAFGLMSGRATGAIERLPKPVFLPFAAPRFQDLPADGNTSGRERLSYLTGLVNLEREMRRFREVVRREQAVVLVDRYIADAIPGLEAAIQRLAGESTRLITVDPPASAIIAAIPEDARAVYLGPLVRLPNSERQALIDGLNERRLPTYASEGRAWVEAGAFVSVVDPGDDRRRFRRVALDVIEARNGENMARFSTSFEPREQLVINMGTARAIGVWPRFELMTEAELLGSASMRRGRRITLRGAVREAVQGNLDYQANTRDAEIAERALREAQGRWLPTVDAQADFNWIDPDGASSLFTAERQLSWGVSAQQTIYSPALHQGIRASREQLESVRQGVEARELDLVQEAATAYINVLRARTGEDVNRENLGRIRQNLSLAEVRVQVGAAGRQEVFRWQIEIADSRAAVIAASATRNQAQIALNRLLNRENLEEPFQVSEPVEPDEGVVLDERVVAYADDPWSFHVLRDFVVVEAIRNSPELKQLDAAIRAQEQQVRGLRRALYVPDVFVSAGFNHIFRRAGEGGDDAQPIMGVDIPPRDNFAWQVGAGLRFRIFGADRYPAIDQVDVAIDQLETQRSAAAQSIEQRVRSAMHQAGASRAAVRLRRDAANAASENLALVRDAYRNGTVNIITLIDAQNQSLLSSLQANNATYDFMVDFLAVERASGAFGFRMTEDERNDFVTRLQRFAAEREGEEQ